MSSAKDVEAVYRMLYPKPKPLLQYCHELVRHGELIYFSPNTNSTKPRYFFLFDTALLLTKRTGKKRYWLKVYVHLRNGVTLIDNGPTDTQFRLMVTVKGRSRPIIMYGKNQQHKDLWVRDLKHVLWAANGKKGPDPSLSSPAASPAGTRRAGTAQQPAVAGRTAGKDAKQQRNTTGERTLYYPDDDDDDGDDDDFNEADNQSDDDSDGEEENTEVEFMNEKREDQRQQGLATAASSRQEDRLAHGLDSLVFDPFSDFIPPTATSAAAPPNAAAYSVPPSIPAVGGISPFAGPQYAPTTVTPFGPVSTTAYATPAQQGNPFAPPIIAQGVVNVGYDGSPVVLPQQQLFLQQQQNMYLQQQLHLQQQLQQLSAVKQHYQQQQQGNPDDPFFVLAQRDHS